MNFWGKFRKVKKGPGVEWTLQDEYHAGPHSGRAAHYRVQKALAEFFARYHVRRFCGKYIFEEKK